jgi:murein DD-endopeptidase MepM/ murein hydrolase activator NlpD
VIQDIGGGVRVAYCHLSRTSVRVGQQVREGQQLGAVGTTGNSTGPHLHIEARTSPFGYNNRITDPTRFFGPGGGPSGGPVTYLSKLRFGQKDSDSVRNLQRALNSHLGIRLPVVGNYGPATDEAVRRCQRLHGLGNDPAGRSSVGPRQAAHLNLPGVRP